MLIKMRAKIAGAGKQPITIEGVHELKGTSHRIIPDRIEAGTFLVAGAITHGELELLDANPSHLASVNEKLRDTGVHIETGPGRITVRGGEIRPADVARKEYPRVAPGM